MPGPTVKPDRAPVPQARPILSYSPVIFSVEGREAPLEMRVVVPAEGEKLPVLLFSHGHGASNFIASMRGYGPLVDFYAARGFAVIIPTHQNSKTLDVDPTGPEGPLHWKSRPKDMSFIIDHLEEIANTVPTLAGRIDKDRIVAVGHSLGGHTVAMLAGMRVNDPTTGEIVDFTEPRIKATVLISPPGDGADASPKIAERFPALVNGDFGAMNTPSLVITGSEDVNPDFSEREDWRGDAFKLAPGPKSLLFLDGAGHIFGGISGYDAAETTDESPERVATVQRVTWAYLWTALYPENAAWSTITTQFQDDASGRIESK